MSSHSNYIPSLLLMTTLISFTTAATPTPSSPPLNITIILENGNEFSRFIGLLKTTKVSERLETQIDPRSSKSRGGLTIFAPNDNAFASLKSGSINSLSYDQITKVVLFHCVPSFLSFSDLQTAVSPMRTEAGDVGADQFLLAITVFATQVKLWTGVRRGEASVSSTLYSNTTQRLAIYEIDKLLAPKAVFPITPFVDAEAPAPTPAFNAKKKKDDNEGAAPVADSGSGDGGPRSARDVTSGGGGAPVDGTFLHNCYYVVLVFWLFMIRQ